MDIILGSSKRYGFRQIKNVGESKPTVAWMLRKQNSLELPPRIPLTDLLLWEAMDKRDRTINPATFFNIEGGASALNPAPKDPFSLGTVTHKDLREVKRVQDTLSVKKPSKVRG
jgi:hypothetical protein